MTVSSIHHFLLGNVLTLSNELRVNELIRDKGRCCSGSVFLHVSALQFFLAAACSVFSPD